MKLVVTEFIRVLMASYILILDWESPPIFERYGLWDYDVEVSNAYSYYITAYSTDWDTDPSEIVTIDTFLPTCSLISPLDGETITNPNPVFEWSPVGSIKFPLWLYILWR